ncbi:uncharacterized protein LOC127871322 [Dreissena polymorpha]|uniref:uncharacterized protein LOC127871322 n=1 Tax=Dreissena polymorpha TaxID=45954 RepID=UPI002263EEC6|nr:uncharacterized protein LOC127871322 [Dreissena polymorpha]XP_052270085.1 uncharacterized protein LOC127871322 [Dreissena polymorpha]XP_052270086.1 uncharacterized protein LOC127871322 [Dreissena polymorpha]XP_052270087.1 uncharacterized protein LOC127871322 [Dreissena polymorpha]XP_052270088.1 uncharacterized protein LOC127871322 [Dreissena polymorpha]XP_052270089.1 uncharacterized protein LOC127871322 [Dreissena polymorpha]XP_052270091.1 uncharacterized protein LOC127871322 [Dreissena po
MEIWQNCKIFVFSVLAFGITSAPKVFTKTLRPLIKYWRLNGLRVVIFLDDGWCVNATYEKTLNDGKFILETLQRAGFVLNMEKSIFIPVQCLEWVGFVWDLKCGVIRIPERRIQNTLECLNKVQSSLDYITARNLTCLAGKIISMSPVLGNVCLLKTKVFYRLIESRLSWDSYLSASECKDDLEFWHNVFSAPFEKPLFTDYIPEVFVFSDASDRAGAAIIQHDGSISHRMWSDDERGQSSTFRELKAIQFCLLSFLPKLKGKCVLWHTDSKNCVSVIKKGSTQQMLHNMALYIFFLCAANAISLKIVWLSRTENTVADSLSRLIDYDDYGVSKQFFYYIDSLYGPHDVDRFANSYNHVLPRYNSLCWTPTTEGVDAFSVNWCNNNNWLVPPVYLIPKV